MTTVGYGDFAPRTIIGRVIIMFTSLWGAFMISLLVVSVSSIFDLKKHQKMALHHIRLTKSAAKTISSAFKFYQEKKKYYSIKVMMHPKIAKNS